MEIVNAVVLSIVQGVTELLPVSSSGHLIISARLLSAEADQYLLALLHFASALAIIYAYRAKYKKLFINDMRGLIVKVLFAMIPIGVAGVFLSDIIEKTFYNASFIAWNLIFWGALMVLTERLEMKREARIQEVEKIGITEALIVGILQVLSLLPGTSRSAITTMAGMWAGVKKSEALDFAFLIGAPLLIGSFGFSFLKSSEQILSLNIGYLLTGIILTFIVSYISVRILKKIQNEKFLTWFGVYRLIIGAVILLAF